MKKKTKHRGTDTFRVGDLVEINLSLTATAVGIVRDILDNGMLAIEVKAAEDRLVLYHRSPIFTRPAPEE